MRNGGEDVAGMRQWCRKAKREFSFMSSWLKFQAGFAWRVGLYEVGVVNSAHCDGGLRNRHLASLCKCMFRLVMETWRMRSMAFKQWSSPSPLKTCRENSGAAVAYVPDLCASRSG